MTEKDYLDDLSDEVSQQIEADELRSMPAGHGWQFLGFINEDHRRFRDRPVAKAGRALIEDALRHEPTNPTVRVRVQGGPILYESMPNNPDHHKHVAAISTAGIIIAGAMLLLAYMLPAAHDGIAIVFHIR